MGVRRSSGRGGGNGGRPVWAALAAFFVTALLLAGVERMVAASLTAAERASVTDRAATLRAQLETVVNRNVLLLRGMAAYIAGHPELSEEEFTTLARDLVTQGRHIRSMAFARGTTIAYIHPRAGNESAIGLDLSLHPEQREAALRAITARDVVVAGPVELVEGGTALIGRMPVHRSPAGGEPRSGAYVGLVTLPLDAAAIFAEAGLDAAGSGLAVALRGRDATGPAGEVFFGDPAVFGRAPVLQTVALAGDGGWQLAAMPAAGWGAGRRGTLWTVRLLALCLAGAAGGLAWVVVSRSQERRAVEAALRQTSTVDLATGAGNRRLFLTLGAAEVARSRRFGHPLSVVVLRLWDAAGLDGSAGPGAAAAVMRAVAEYGRRDLRVIDTLARLDDDTFALLLPETPAAAADTVVSRLRRHFDLMGVPWRDRTISPRFATAVAALQQEDMDIEQTLGRGLAQLVPPPAAAAPAGAAGAGTGGRDAA